MELALGRELGNYPGCAGLEVIHHYGTERHVVEICGVTAHHYVLGSEISSLIGHKAGGIVVGIEIYYMACGGYDGVSGTAY